MKRIFSIATSLVLLSSLKAHADWAAAGKDVTTGPGGTSVTTHLVPVPDKAKITPFDQCIVDTAKQFKDQDGARKDVDEARKIIVQHNPQSMFRSRDGEMDDDGKITEFLKCYGYEKVTAIDIDKVRAVMSQRGIQHVWDLIQPSSHWTYVSSLKTDQRPSPDQKPVRAEVGR
jgi:hypothetical protein